MLDYGGLFLIANHQLPIDNCQFAFVIYVSDLEDWLEYAISLTYADTSTSVSGKSIEDVLRKLQIDAKNVLKFMASNGLFANPSKTTFIVINDK